MSPRPRTVSDDEILAAAARVIGRIGPGRFTLGDVGDEAGLSPAGLVQRFGSKGGLVLALAAHRAAGVAERFAAARQLHAGALDALLNALAGVAEHAETPQALANELAFAQMHLDQPAVHAHAARQARATLSEIRALLEEALRAGELMDCDPGDLSRTVQTAHTGALATWAVYRSGTLDEWLRGEIEAVLEPYRV